MGRFKLANLFSTIGWKCLSLVAEWMAGKPGCTSPGRKLYIGYSGLGCGGMTLYD